MKKILINLQVYVFAIILLVLAGGLTGCQKNDDLVSLNGSISGKIVPAGAAATIAAIQISGTDSTLATIDSSGNFNITGLKPGEYMLRFSAMPGFVSPGPIPVTVVAGQNSDVGKVVFTRSGNLAGGSTGSISGKISPAPASTNVWVVDGNGALLFAKIPDANGNFRFDSIMPGTYTIRFLATSVFTAPANRTVTVNSGTNTDLGTIVFNPVVFQTKAIDTIPGTHFLTDASQVNYFLTRASNDSAIVFTGHLYMNRLAVTPELAAALNKIIVIKGALMINSVTPSSLEFSALKELGQLNMFGATSITTLDFSVLKKITSGVVLFNCPALTTLKMPALNQLDGTLSLRGTGLKDLSAFSRAMFKPFNFEITDNLKLTSLLGMNFTSDSVYNCTIRNNPLLTTLDGMQGIKQFKNETVIISNPVLKTLTGLDNIKVGKHLMLADNPQLSSICAAKKLINILKDAPAYQVLRNNGIQTIRITMQPLVAYANGSYATRADLVSAIGQCP